MDIGDLSRKRAAEIDKLLPDKEKSLETLQEEVRALRKERRDLGIVIRRLEGTNGNGAPAVTDEQVKAAVVELGVATSRDVAEKLGVTPRNVARKLRKLVDDGELTGTPDDGYKPVK